MKHRKLAILGVALALLAGACAWLVGSTAGLRFLAARALPHLPVSLAPGDIEGRLVGPLSLGPLQLAAPGLGGSVERVTLDWRPMAMLRGELHVLDLQIVRPRLELRAMAAPASAAPQDGAPPSLPLKVLLERLEVVDGRLAADDAVLVDELHLELAGRAAGRSLVLDRLSLRSSRGTVVGHARAGLAPHAPWDVDLAWRASIEEHEVAGHTRISGQLERLAVDQQLTAPLVARLAGVLENLPDAPAWNFELESEPLAPQAGPWPPFLDGLAARLQLTGTMADTMLSGSFELPALAAGTMALDAQGGWRDEAAVLQRLALTLPDGAAVAASGRAVPGETLAAEFSLEGERLRWPVGAAEPEISLPRLAVQGTGAGDEWQLKADAHAVRAGLPAADLVAELLWSGTTLEVQRLDVNSSGGELYARIAGLLETADGRLDYRLSTDARVELPGYPAASGRLSARGDASGADIRELDVRILDGRVEGGGRIAWAGERQADFNLRFAGIDPASLAPDWPGRLAGALTLTGLPESAGGLEVALRGLQGELKSLPVAGDARLNYRATEQVLHGLSLTLGGASLEARGRIDDSSVALDAALVAPALDALHDEAAGSLDASVRLAGSRELPEIRLEADGAGLRWQATEIRALRIDATVDMSGEQASRIRAAAEGLKFAPGPEAAVSLAADGTPADHEAQLDYQRGRAEQGVRLALAGGIAGQGWAGRLEALALAVAGEEIWALQAPAELAAARGTARLSRACMDGTLGSACLDAGWTQAGPWRGRASLARLDLEPLSEWLGNGLLARGVVSGELEVTADDEAFRGLSGGLALTAGDLRAAGGDDDLLLAWQEGRLELAGDTDAARAELDLVLAGEDRITGRMAVGWNAADPALDGRVEARLERLDIITELVPDLAELRGSASAEAVLAGTLRAPVVSGRFEWLDGTAEIPALGLAPHDIRVQAALAESTLSFTAAGRSGDGGFQLDGRFDLAAETVEGRATLQGDDLLLANLPEARITASPDLRLRYTGRNLNISGEVKIPAARITGVGGPSAVTTSPDEVIVGPRARPEDEGLDVASRVRVTVGPDVQVQAAGLRGRVEGSILTVTQPRQLPWGRGELRVVDGTFGAFGQRLEIETGRLIYSGGPLENPGLDIRAVRRVDTVTAGALVRGTLRQPELSLYSDPPMPRANVLSYLTLGKNLDELQAGEQQTVNQAANSLALSGGGLIAQDLGRRLGFDDVAVTADDRTGGASVVISKYLGGGLYVSYGLGLFDTVNTLRLRYQLNQRLSVEATSGEASAADLIYTFERD